MKCIMCESTKVKIIDKVDARELARQYKALINLDISYQFVKDGEMLDSLDLCRCEECGVAWFAPIIIGDDAFYNAVYKDFYNVKSVFDVNDAKCEFKYSLPYLFSGARVLDVGSGTGWYFNFLDHYFSAIDYTGLEKSSSVVEHFQVKNNTASEAACNAQNTAQKPIQPTQNNLTPPPPSILVRFTDFATLRSRLTLRATQGLLSTSLGAKAPSSLPKIRPISSAKNNSSVILNQTIEEFAKTSPKPFDVIVSFQVIEHVEDVGSYLKAMVGLLKEGGLLILSAPNDSYQRIFANNIINMPPHHISRFDREGFAKIADIFGLKLVKIIEEPYPASQIKEYKVNNLANALFGYKTLNVSLWRKVIIKLGNMFFTSKDDELARRGLRGHTMVAVYAKARH